MKQYYIYIMASHSYDPVLYIGVTSNLEGRNYQHKNKSADGFTTDYNCDKLVYFEITESVEAATSREKQLKNWHREWKLNLIKKKNHTLRDLSKDWS